MKTGQFLNRQALKLIGAGFALAVVLLIVGTAMYSYAEEPEFCSSCHVMQDYYLTWHDSTHKSLKCIDCHLPHNGIVGTLATKAQVGAKDVFYQTLRSYPLNIEMTEKGNSILQRNCLRCHEATVSNTSMTSGDRRCITCHRNLIH